MSLSERVQNPCIIKFNGEERVHHFTHLLFTLKVYALSSDEDDDITVTSVKSGEQTEKAGVDSDAESDKSDVLATRALIQKLSPAKPAKTVQSRVSEMSSLKLIQSNEGEIKPCHFPNLEAYQA